MKALIFLAALALFVITVSFFEYVGPLLLGIDGPDPTRYSDAAYMADFLARQPAASFLLVALAHFLGAVVGGLVLGLGGLGRRALWGLAILCTIAGIANLVMLPGQPVWFWVLDLLTYAPGVWLGYTWVARTRALVAERAA